jgi:fructokinase
MKYDFLTIGGATEDITVYTREGKVIDNPADVLAQRLIAFEFGAKLKVDQAYTTYGGGAANAAVCLAKLGFRVGAMVALGSDDRGERVLSNFRKMKVDTAVTERIKKEVTGFSFLLVGQEHEHVVFSNRAANSKLTVGPKELKAINASKWIYLTSLSGRWQQVLTNIFKGKSQVAWNPGHIQLHAGFKAIGKFLKRTTVLTVNQDEAIELVVSNPKYKNLPPQILNDTHNLLEMIRLYGPKIVIVTRGKDGADAYDGDKFYHQEILHERKRVDTTGVGDAFGSTFIAGLELFGGDIQEAMRLSVINTSSVISLQGAQNGLLTRPAILRKLKQIS